MTGAQTGTVQAIVNIFETGRVRGNYGAISVLKGDNGHLSYGRSQASLGSHRLFDLLNDYCNQPDATVADALRGQLPRFDQKDISLDTDQDVRALLKKAGEDPAMQRTQDRFFATNYLAPALDAAQRLKIMLPLGQAVVYDSHIQGGWARVQGKVGTVEALGGEQTWIPKYIEARRQWLLGLPPPLPSTVYRMDAFDGLIKAANWMLGLPIVVRGVTIRPEDVDDTQAATPQGPRALTLTTPYMTGDDVKAVQGALGIPADGVYGPFTDAKVTAFKAQKGITEVGVASITRAALGLKA